MPFSGTDHSHRSTVRLRAAAPQNGHQVRRATRGPCLPRDLHEGQPRARRAPFWDVVMPLIYGRVEPGGFDIAGVAGTCTIDPTKQYQIKNRPGLKP